MILKTIKQEKTIEIEIPVAFQCDICGKIIEIHDEYELKYYNKVADQMAVVKYDHPSGGFRDDTVYEELHCCSSECVAKAIKRVPFRATITIPMSKGFIK